MLFKRIEEYLSSLDTKRITEQRKTVLQPLAEYIQKKVNQKEQIRICFICTHNSRRSHLAQVWAQTLSSYFKIDRVFCYSGGTESTALFPMVVDTLAKQGFQIQKFSENTNPVYAIKYAINEYPIIGFSKKMDDEFNPKTDFVAVMTCSQADEGCPFVPGAKKRIPITYEDPKTWDNSPQQAEKYAERSLQIAMEMFYVFSQIRS